MSGRRPGPWAFLIADLFIRAVLALPVLVVMALGVRLMTGSGE